MGVLASVAGWFGSGAAGGREERIVTQVVERVGTELREAAGYQERLLPAIDAAADHCNRLAAEIPGPIAVSAASHATDPRLQALFPAAEEIAVALGRSLAVRESLPYFADGRSGESSYCLLGMRRRRLEGNGASESPIADHTFRSLGSDEGEVRLRVIQAAFDGLLTGFAARWQELCRSHVRSAAEQRLESEMARQSSADAREPSIHEEHLRQAALRPTPEHMLSALCEWLNFAAEQVRLEGSMDVGGLSLPVLVGRDRRHWPVCLARISLAEAVAAVERETRAHRYILI